MGHQYKALAVDSAVTTNVNTYIANGNLTISTVGKKISIATGTNASIGTATLVAGVVTVSTTAVATGSKIFLTHANKSGNIGELWSSNIVNATSFKINADNVTDTSDINWWIIN